MGLIEWGRVHSHIMLAAIWAAGALGGAAMMAFGTSDDVRLVGIWLVAIFGALFVISLAAAVNSWRSQARPASSEQAPERPELGIHEFITLGERIAEQFGLAFRPVDTAFKDVAGAYKKYWPEYLLILQSGRPDRHAQVSVPLREMAKAMMPSFEAIDPTVPRLTDISTIISQGFDSLAIEYETNPDPTQLRKSRQDVSEFVKRVETLRGLHEREFLGLLKKFRNKDSNLTAACNKGSQSVRATLSALEKISDSCRDAIKTADRLLRDRRRS
jgi:hypothetical protein